MIKKVLVVCGVMYGAINAYAIDLHEALSYSYKTNQDIKNAQQQFLINSENFVQAVSDFLPDISLQINTQSNKSTSKSQYSQRPPTKTGPDVSRSLIVKQNVFNGGQSTMGLKIAQEQFNQIRAILYNSEQKALSEALSAYLGVCTAKLKYEIANETLTSYKQSLETATEQMKVGEATLTDVSAAQASYLQAQAGKSSAYAALVAAKANFKDIIGVEPDEDINFPSAPDDLPSDFDAFNKVVSKSNFDLIAASSVLKQAKDGVKSNIGALLPSADLQVQAGRNYLNPEDPNSGRLNTSTVTTTLAVTVPILTRGGINHSRVRTSKTKARMAAYTLDSTKNDVSAQTIGLWQQYLASKDSLVYADEGIKAQTIALEGVKNEYSVGTKTMLDVLQQQDKLNNVRSQAVDIKQSYITTAYKMKAFMGQMTAKKMKLKAKYFEPELEFRNLKHKVVGF